ncbi:MAG: hypothetical protein K0R90_1119, partial [Oscillospiraceae bacterium]|nr:hypothetical protein [Oscillospiraceae bacterium]
MSISKSDIITLKNMLPFWESLADEQKVTLVNSVTRCTYEKGRSLHSGSQDCSGLFVVISGQIRVYILSDKGKEITLYRLFERDICIFSASCIMKNINFEIYVRAEKQTEAFLIPTAIYDELLKSSLPVSDYMSQLISSRFSDVMWIVEQIVFMSFDKRLAIFLKEQMNIEKSTVIPITHEEIAHHLGTAREVVTRMLGYFQSEGIISSLRGEI